MRMAQLFIHDCKEGIWRRKAYLLLPMMLALFSGISLHLRISNAQILNHPIENYTVMDYWITLILGSKQYKFDVYTLFSVPVSWMCVYLFLLIGIGEYPLKDLNEWGYQVILRTKSRWNFWAAKILWCFTYVLLYFSVCFLTLMLFSVLDGAQLSMHPSKGVMNLGGMGKPSLLQCTDKQIFGILFILPMLLASLLAILQMFISLYVQPIYSLCFSLLLLIVSAYKRKWFLIGNFGMPYRIKPITRGGLQPRVCVAVLLLLLIACIFGAYAFFRRKNILEEKDLN